ncbi:hypothetical protein VaNZ11_002818 [Volvox africanus]|uniref:Uncharacterized protein n=1 Tax=Volvox africanus TaxID=51714 RepID=A0ABQ5RU02_9CHLO|nr:hypothetical protein VaNZ11_002818 [Volvox africanus]
MSFGVKADTSKRLGALLLRGWAMLGENCPECQVPLMKERTSHERLCVNCDTTFVPDGQGLRPTNRPLQKLADADLQQQQHQSQENEGEEEGEVEGEQDGHGLAGDEEDGVCDYDPRADPRLGPFASPAPECQEDAEIKKSHGQSFGQTKLVECPGNRKGTLDVGATAGVPPGPASQSVTTTSGIQDRSGQGQNKPLATYGLGRVGAPSAFMATSGAPVGKPSSGAVPSAEGPEDIADLLAAKMLQGWALLDKYCPRCNTVLVRSKANKRMFCVACDAWVVPETDALQQQQQQQEQQQQQKGEEEVREKEQPQAEPPQAEPAPAVQLAIGSISAQPQPQPHPQTQPEPPPQSLLPPLSQQQHRQTQPEPPPQSLLPPLPQQQYRQTQPEPPPQSLLRPLPQQQHRQTQPEPLPQSQQVTFLQPSSPDPRVFAALRGLPAFVSAPAHLPSGAIPSGGAPYISADFQQPQQTYSQLQQSQPQPPLTYQQFFLPVAPVTTMSAGSATFSLGSSPPQQRSGGGSSFTHEVLLSALRSESQQQPQVRPPLQGSSFHAGQAQGTGGNATGLGAGGNSGNGGNKQPSSTTLLLSIGRTVALKMTEAQGLLERTPALDTERARSYIALISECLELLSKLHSLQQ